MKKTLLTLLLASIGFGVSAQQPITQPLPEPQTDSATVSVQTPSESQNNTHIIVPAVDQTAELQSYVQQQAAARNTPPPINLLSGIEVALSEKERNAVRLSQEWQRRNDFPARGSNGTVVFNYGSSMPSVVCAPLYPCNIILQAGERVNQGDAGDPIHWKITPSVFGFGDNTTTDTGLETALSIATDRRLYVVKLVSRNKDWMPMVSFAYQDDVQQAWQSYHQAQAQRRSSTVIQTTGQPLELLDFNYRISGDSPSWRPVRVYTDGQKTYIQFSAEMKFDEAPALVAISGSGIFSSSTEELVNYRIVGDRYIVDKVLTQAALISGVGREQVRVTLQRGK